MLDTAQAIIKQSAKKLGLDEKNTTRLLSMDAEHQFDIILDNGTKLKAYRVQHNNQLGPYKGGIRFHPNVDLDEARALATLMSLKTAAVGLPLGGGKGGVSLNPKDFTDEQLEEISRKYVQYLEPHIGPDKDIPAPDVNTNSTIIDWMVDEYERISGDTTRASFTGKSIKGGGSLGRNAATGRGGVMALRELLIKLNDNKKLSYSVQGFGNVGSFFAKVAKDDQPNWKLVSVSDSSAVVTNLDGLDADRLVDYKDGGGRFSDFNDSAFVSVDADSIISSDVDVLVLAALEDAVTSENMKNVKAKYIIEMANGPITKDAIDYLTSKGKIILPGVIANAGGVIVSYLEWVQNKQGEKWTEEVVNDKLNDYIVKAIDDLIKANEKYEADNLSEAAFLVAIKRITASS